MTEQFYEKQLVSLIRQNQFLKNDLKRFKVEAFQGLKLLIKSILAQFNADNRIQIQSYVESKKQQILTNDNMGKLSQMVVESIREKIKQRQAKELEKTTFYQSQMSQMLKTHLSSFQKSQSSKSEESNSTKREKQENLLLQQLRHEIDVLNQKEEAYKKKLESLKAIIRELENQVIQSKYICECQKRTLREEIKHSREQKEKAEFELKRALYSYDQLALHQDNQAPRLYKNERNKAKTNS